MAEAREWEHSVSCFVSICPCHFFCQLHLRKLGERAFNPDQIDKAARDDPQDLFTVRDPLEKLYDQLEEASDNIFKSDKTAAILDELWDRATGGGAAAKGTHRAAGIAGASSSRAEAVKQLIDGRGHVPVRFTLQPFFSQRHTMARLIQVA